MTYELIIADRTFSSWSLRGWLMFEKFNIPYRTRMVGLYDGTLKADLAGYAPARQVPVMRTPQGDIVGDSLAMAETLAEVHGDIGFWPKDTAARMLARWMAAEIHSSFNALRDECPMQLMHQVRGFTVSDAVRGDLDRLQELWSLARSRHGGNGPWLFGEYSLADVFYVPVAARIAGYGLDVGLEAAAYVEEHLNELAFRRWRAMGATKTYDPLPAIHERPHVEWPGPVPLGAKLAEGPGENAICPYSGLPSVDFLEIDGRVFGFCNAFCRDKTRHDPAAWPKFMAIYHS